MRTILRYIDGKPVWSDNVPSASTSSRPSGSLVVGGPGSVELARITSRAHAEKKRQEKA